MQNIPTIQIPAANYSASASNELAKKLLRHSPAVKKAIVFSPHYDDAVLSMGALLTWLIQKNIQITCVNVFTKGSTAQSPLTRKLLSQAGCTSTRTYFHMREYEDTDALRQLGKISILNLGFIDAAWRKIDRLHCLYPQTTLGIHPNEDSLEKRLISAFQSLRLDSTNALLFAPLGRGKHIDHLFVRNICTSVFRNVVYYEDFPYSQQYGSEDTFIKEKKLQNFPWQGDTYATKAKAILAYKTQRTSLFKDNSLSLPFENFYLP